MARMTSFAMRPAFSAGPPAITDATIGWVSGSTPSVPISKRPSADGRTDVVIVCPARITDSSMSRLALVATRINRSCQVSTGF